MTIDKLVNYIYNETNIPLEKKNGKQGLLSNSGCK